MKEACRGPADDRALEQPRPQRAGLGQGLAQCRAAEGEALRHPAAGEGRVRGQRLRRV